jgi:hypothetical protein
MVCHLVDTHLLSIEDCAFRKEKYRKVTPLELMADRPWTLPMQITKNILPPENTIMGFCLETY